MGAKAGPAAVVVWWFECERGGDKDGSGIIRFFPVIGRLVGVFDGIERWGGRMNACGLGADRSGG